MQATLKVYSAQIGNERYGYSKRPTHIQQDSFFEGTSDGWLSPIAAVFDGHGDDGTHISQMCVQVLGSFKFPSGESKNIPDILSTLPTTLENRVKDDSIYENDTFEVSGSTMTALFYENSETPSLWVVNLGDSRAAYYGGKGMPQNVWKGQETEFIKGIPVTPYYISTTDHAFGHGPDSTNQAQTSQWWGEEKKMVENLGGSVIRPGGFGVYRTDGYLMLSRSLFDSHRHVSKKPDIYQIPIKPNTPRIMVIASDGVWDVLSVEKVGDCLVNPLAVISMGGHFHDKAEETKFQNRMSQAVSKLPDSDIDVKDTEKVSRLLTSWKKGRWTDLSLAAEFIVTIARIAGSIDDCTCQIVSVNL